MNLGTYLVTDDDRSGSHSTVDVVEAAIAGGVDIVQLREKGRSARDRYELGLELREVTREAGVPLIINDRVDLARAVEADGVHLGDDDVPVAVARECLDDDAIVGRSVSTVEAAREAADAGADYLGVGAIYGTTSKDTAPDESRIGLDRVRAIAAAVATPFVGIGGVTPENAGDVVAAGADGVAVISAITAADDPEAATRALAETVQERRATE
jgi:thiamine-phosphate pyrophosphorylase